jgi:hypothetical protein
VEKVQDVQDRSIDNKVVIVEAEFQKEAKRKLENVEEIKKTEMVIIEKKEEGSQRENKKGIKKRTKKSFVPEEDEGKIIDIKG